MSNMIVAIDGPSASGKSTVSRRVAACLGYVHVDSGSFYRALTWQFLREGIAENEDRMRARLPSLRMEFAVRGGAVNLTVEGQDPGAALRGEPVQERVSAVAAMPDVRRWVTAHLRAMVRFGNLVMEGRDIASAVFPGAAFKFYLDASQEARARRRQRDQQAQTGVSPDADCVLASLQRRDARDSSRAADPLVLAPGALRIDTTDLSVDEVAGQIAAAVRAAAGLGRPAGYRPRVYAFSRRLCRLYLKLAHCYRTFGTDFVPASGGVLLVANHASFLDPIAVGCDLRREPVVFMARDTLFRASRLMRWWGRAVGALPISRDKGDIRALKTAIEAARGGAALCLFPEGTRSRDGRLQPVKPGIGFLIDKAAAPVVPVYVSGTFAALPRGRLLPWPARVSVYFGAPLFPSAFDRFRGYADRYQKIADLVMANIARLNPAASQGADSAGA